MLRAKTEITVPTMARIEEIIMEMIMATKRGVLSATLTSLTAMLPRSSVLVLKK